MLDSFREHVVATAIGGLIVVAIGSGIGMALRLDSRVSKLETNLSNLQSQVQHIDQRVDGFTPSTTPTTTRDGSAPMSEVLIQIVKKQQRLHVKESSGTEAYQGFTDDDLAAFVNDKTTDSIADSLKKEPQFLDVVKAIRGMDPGMRLALFNRADKPLHRTWTELGEISSKGQTEAGQKAEIMIADAIVGLAKELTNMPTQEFDALYNQ